MPQPSRPPRGGLRGRLLRRRRTSQGGRVPVLGRFLRQKELNEGGEPYPGPAKERYREFEAVQGGSRALVGAYWCTTKGSRVALTIRRRPLILPDVVRLHWATDWTTKDKPKVMTLLYRCESLSVRVHEVLRDTSQRLAMQSLFTVISFLLGFAETDRVNNDRAVAEVDRTTRST